MPNEENPLIPEQQTGAATNTESSRELQTEEEAKSFYQTVRSRLLHVNEWHHLAGAATASFQLTDHTGTDLQREAREGDLFKIDIPGPGTVTGEGYDWVRIEAVEEDNDASSECTAIKVRPTPSPVNDRQDVAHFFSEEATSSFIVRREGVKVTAGVYGRNEKPNTHTEKAVDKARNVAVAAGAISGFSKIQWKSLVNGLVKES